MEGEKGPLFTYVSKLYDLKEKNDGLSFEQIEGVQVSIPIQDSHYLNELRRMMKSKVPQHVVEDTAKQFDVFVLNGPLYTYVSKLYDLKGKNEGLSFEQIEGVQITSPIPDSKYLNELRRMMRSKVPRNVVERTAKKFDASRAKHGRTFRFSDIKDSDEED